MAAAGSSSDLLPLNTLEIETAWHLLIFLIRLGEPARPAELAWRSGISPDLVKLLCQIPGSPLILTSGGFVGASDVAVRAFVEFVGSGIAWFVPRDFFRVTGLRRVCKDVRLTYTRKRKAWSLGNAAALVSSSKKRTLLTHQRDEGEPMNAEGLLEVLSLSNGFPTKVNFDVASVLANKWNSVGMDTADCGIVGFNQAYALPMPVHYLSGFKVGNISSIREEDMRASVHDNTNSVVSYNKIADLSCYEHEPLNHVLSSSTLEEHALESVKVLEPVSRPSLLDGMQDQPSLPNQTLGKDHNIHSLELVVIASIPEAHALKRLRMSEPDSGASQTVRVLDQTKLHQIEDHNSNKAFLLEHRNQPTGKATGERNLHSKEDKIMNDQLPEFNKILVAILPNYCQSKDASTGAFVEDVKNSAGIDFRLQPATVDESTNILEEKQKTFGEPCIRDHLASVMESDVARNSTSPTKEWDRNVVMGSEVARNSTSPTKEQDRNVVGLNVKQKVDHICNINTPSKENRVNAVTKASKNSSEQKLMPNFESFIIEEEEGSGGYGTVYKVQRKDDGKIFAVKCPHANAHSHHVHNEIKMLERFGGRNFVIKYEGSFKSGDSECSVLEHVEHDRPEVLKKDIDLFELQWYGYCLFRALASLHKEAVVHRDVKPGNFLFSSKVNKGFLIDFNLASDLHQKFCRSSKRKMPNSTVNPNPLPDTKPMSAIRSRNLMDRGLLKNVKKVEANDSKRLLISKSSKKKSNKDHIVSFPIIDRSKHGSQTADVSGVTSAKDQTSTKTPVDWMKQPMPCKGRKELINFVHEAMHNPKDYQPVLNGPSSQRKRIAAPMGKTDMRHVILTPMPLHYGGSSVAGAGIHKNKANEKFNREGPCVGTKGFRAPEVLFKSFHQGCKIDIWSAGVTLLYLMIGRAPFGGDPEQNINEIAKLRGSEDLWEVAKLHNCESSFPVNLLDVRSLKSMELRDWCAKNTRRPDFLELIPESLFDLVDRCLTVNPRLRFSAEEALMHKFFSTCHESIKKQRLLRKLASADPSNSNS